MMRTGAYDGALGLGRRRPAGSSPRAIWRPSTPAASRTRPTLFDAPARDTVDGRTYAVPQGWGANLLMWRTDVVRPAPTSWGVVFDARVAVRAAR